MQEPQLNKEFGTLDLPRGYFTLDELEGFMHALVITPDMVKPSEWLPAVFYGDISVFQNEDSGNAIAEVLLDCHSHFSALRNKGTLKYPYDIKALDEGMFSKIDAWTRGFWYGLSLRLFMWKSIDVKPLAPPKVDPVIKSLEIFRALADETFNSAPMLEEIKKNTPANIDDSEWESRFRVILMDAIPVSVHTLQEFARYMIEQRKEELAMQTETIVH